MPRWQEAPAIGDDPRSALNAAVIDVESGGNPNAVSPDGARGLMQIMPATAKQPGFGIDPVDPEQLFDAEVNRKFGAAYLDALVKRYGGDQDKALAAFNAGPGTVDRAVKEKGADYLAALPRETQDYVRKVKERLPQQAAATVTPAPTPEEVARDKPRIQNDDGSVSTERSITVQVDELNGGKPTNIPTIVNGRQVSEDEAVRAAISSGTQFPSFPTVREAVAAAQQRSDAIGRAVQNDRPTGRLNAGGDAVSARWRQAPPVESGTPTQFARGANAGIADTLGAPVDLVNAALSLVGLGSEKPVGGSASLRSGMNVAADAVGHVPIVPKPGEEDPDTLAGSVGKMTGSGAAMLLPVGAAAKGAREVMTLARPAPKSTLGNVVQDVVRAAVKQPARFAATEATAATGAGIAGFEARKHYPDSLAAEALAEIAGGLTAGGAVAGVNAGVRAAVPAAGRAAIAVGDKLPMSHLAIQFGRRLRESITPRGAAERARTRIQQANSDPVATLRAGEEADVIPNAPLTQIQRTGDPGLLTLERSIMEETPQLARQHQERFADINQAIRESLRGMAGDDAPTPDQAREYFQNLMDTRIQVAAAKADERIAALGGRGNREDANTLARVELDKALRSARQQESQLWSAVPKDAPSPIENVTAAFQRIVAETPEAQRGSIPSVAKRLLTPETVEPSPPGMVPIGQPMPAPGKPTTKFPIGGTVKEVWGLRSELLEVSRRARAGGRRNMARIADDLADAALADLNAAPDVDASLTIARDFSRDLNDRFTRGAVGRLLGYEGAGGPSTPAGLTLESTVGRGGPPAREETDALLRAMERTGDPDAMRGHIETFLRDSFRRAAVRDGKIDPGAAQTFIRQREDVLSRFPELRRDLEQSAQAGEAVRIAEGGLDPNVSRAAVYLRAQPGKEIERVVAHRDPAAVMRELVGQAKADPEGRAVAGLKSSFVDYLLKRAQTSAADARDEPFVSGIRLRQVMNDRNVRSAMDALFDAGERMRLDRIRNTAILLDRARTAAVDTGPIIKDQPGLALALAARLGGAQLGRVIATHTGGGTVQTPGIVAGAFRRAVESGVRDPATRLLSDAIRDQDLFRALAVPATGARRQEFVGRQMQGWLAGVLGSGESDDEQ